MKDPHLLEIFDSINEGIYILDKTGNYIYCNSAFLNTKCISPRSRRTGERERCGAGV